MHDIIESVLLTDPQYVQFCDEIDKKTEKILESAEEYDEEVDDSYCDEADIVTDLDEEDLEADDFVDNELLDYCDNYPDLIGFGDGELIDLVAGTSSN